MSDENELAKRAIDRALIRCGIVSPATARERVGFLKRHNLDIKRYTNPPPPGAGKSARIFVVEDDSERAIPTSEIPTITRLWPDALIITIERVDYNLKMEVTS